MSNPAFTINILDSRFAQSGISPPRFDDQSFKTIAIMSHKTFEQFLKYPEPKLSDLSFREVQIILAARKKNADQNKEILNLAPLVEPEREEHRYFDEHTLNEFVRWVSGFDPLVFDFTIDGCYARADFIGRFLMEYGIPFFSLSKIYIISTEYCLNRHLPAFLGCPVAHQYHVSISVQLGDKRRMVIEPIFNQNRAILERDWLLTQGVDAQFVKDMVQQQELGKEIKLFNSFPPHDRFLKIVPGQKFMICRIPINYEITNLADKQNLRYRMIDTGQIQSFSEKLFLYQAAVEMSWVMKYLPSMHLVPKGPYRMEPQQSTL
jgi:hypothetical protein